MVVDMVQRIHCIIDVSFPFETQINRNVGE